jgi:hypothetical protein
MLWERLNFSDYLYSFSWAMLLGSVYWFICPHGCTASPGPGYSERLKVQTVCTVQLVGRVCSTGLMFLELLLALAP